MAECATTAGGTPCRMCARSSRTPRHHERLEPFECRAELVSLNRAGGSHVLGMHLCAFTHGRAQLDAFVSGEDVEALVVAFIARVEVVALRERDGGWPDDSWLEAVVRARGIAQHAVDAHAELPVL